MFILAFLGFASLHSDAQCPRPVKKAKAQCTSSSKIASVKKTKVARGSVVKTTAVSQKLFVNKLPVNTCMIGKDGEYSYITDSSWSGYYPGSTECSINPGLAPRFGEPLHVSSSAFLNNGALPSKYTCEGQQITPPLAVDNVPEGTVSLAVIMYDPKATPSRSNTYWMAWNITSSFIPEGFRGDYMARNPYSKFYGYTAICPVSGDHQYHFKVFALDKKLSLSKDANRAMFEDALSGHVLASGEIIGTYARVR